MVIEYGTGDISYCRSDLGARLFEELLHVVTRPDIKSKPPWRGDWTGFWTISERTIRGKDGYVELFAFGSLRLEVKVDGIQGSVQ